MKSPVREITFTETRIDSCPFWCPVEFRREKNLIREIRERERDWRERQRKIEKQDREREKQDRERMEKKEVKVHTGCLFHSCVRVSLRWCVRDESTIRIGECILSRISVRGRWNEERERKKERN